MWRYATKHFLPDRAKNSFVARVTKYRGSAVSPNPVFGANPPQNDPMHLVMDDPHAYLRQLVLDARTLPPNSLERRQKLAQIYRLVMQSGALWRGYGSDRPYYSDALQEMWEYCFSHLEEYQPEKKRVTTWLDDELKKRLRRYRDRRNREQNRQVHPRPTDEMPTPNPVENVPARPDIQSTLTVWEETVNWVREDRSGRLRETHFRKRADVNCQILFQQRFPSQTPWNDIAEGLELNPSETKDLPKWYNRKCVPLFKEFGRSQGYIEEPNS